MQKTVYLLLILTLLSPKLWSQDAGEQQDEEEPEYILPEDEYINYRQIVYMKGDQTFNITLGALFPLFFGGNSGIITNNVKVGGTGTLAYSHFLTSNWFVGGEIGGMFAATLGNNMLYIIPITVYGGYQFLWNRFEFPLGLSVGGATQRHVDNEYFGLFIKPKVSAFFRLNSEFSFGINGAWWIVPQLPKDSSKNVLGNFFELTISARYHF
ncbi:MAG: hypothetical protein LBQ77_02095 [Treponema sp.]|jgi:hypothetical protein|nr:hypothetical protein [Treponema sp.]